MTSRWRFGTQPKPAKKSRHQRSCTREQKEVYNNGLRQNPLAWETIQKTLTETALETRGTKPPDIKKPYLKDTTIELLRFRDEALAQGHHEQSRIITAQFRHQVKKDRKDYIQEQLRTFTGHQQNWPAIKNLRRTFFPRFSKRGLNKGSLLTSFPNDCATFFATEHWKPRPREITARPPILHDRAHEEGEFTLEELNEAIDTLKPNKARGPDDIITEIMKDLDAINRTELLQLHNDIYIYMLAG